MKNRITVLQLIYGLGLEDYGGGAERFALALSSALDPNEFDVTIVGLWRLGTASEQVRVEALRARSQRVITLADWRSNAPERSFGHALRALLNFVHSEDADIVHSHSQFSDIMASVAGLIHRDLTIVRTPHDGYHREWRRRPVRRALLTDFLYPIVYDAEIAVSHGIQERLNRRLIARALDRKALYIPNAIDLSRFQGLTAEVDELQADLEVPPNAFLIGSVGRLAVEKGYDVLIEAAPQVCTHISGAYFVFVGDGDMREELRQLAAESTVADRLHFVGARADVERLFKCFDLFVSSSRWEGLSTVVLESMASRTPVVATAVGGTASLIQDDVNGLLVPPEDPEALARAIVRAATSSELRARLAEQAWDTAQHFSIERISAEHARLYRSLMRE